MIEVLEEYANTYQLDLFKDEETCKLEADIQVLRKSLDRVRKGTFARISKIQGQYDELQNEFETLKISICKAVK